MNWHLKKYVVVLKGKAILVTNPSSVKHKMQIVSREDAVGIQGLPGPLVAVSALCSRFDQVSRSLRASGKLVTLRCNRRNNEICHCYNL